MPRSAPSSRAKPRTPKPYAKPKPKPPTALDDFPIREELRTAEQIFEFGKLLGEGASGKVYLVKRRSNGTPSALKRIPITSGSLDDVEKNLAEVKLWTELSACSPLADDCAIVEVYDWFWTRERPRAGIVLWIQMALVTGGDALDLFYRLQKDPREWASPVVQAELDRVARRLVPVVATLARMHSLGVFHRDIKPGNILVDEERDRFLVADLGGSCSTKLGNCAYITDIGTFSFLDPRVLATGRLDAATDVYSLGVTVWCLLTLMNPPIPADMAEFKQLAKPVRQKELLAYRKGVADAVLSSLPVDSLRATLLAASIRMMDPDHANRPHLAEVAAQARRAGR